MITYKPDNYIGVTILFNEVVHNLSLSPVFYI